MRASMSPWEHRVPRGIAAALLELAHAMMERPWFYSGLQNLVGWRRARRALVDLHIRPVEGMRVLDLGCGPADILQLLQGVDYIGLDTNSEQLRFAAKCFGHRARFMVGGVEELYDLPSRSFDLVLAMGWLHHVDDQTAMDGVAQLSRLLDPSGRLITVDGCMSSGNSPLTRALLQWDRGGHHRDLEGYRDLLSRHFRDLHVTFRRDMLRVPYALLVLEASPIP